MKNWTLTQKIIAIGWPIVILGAFVFRIGMFIRILPFFALLTIGYLVVLTIAEFRTSKVGSASSTEQRKEADSATEQQSNADEQR